MLAPWKKSCDQPRQCIKKQRHYFDDNGPSSQSYGFSSSHVWIWELDHKEGWALKNWCFWTVVLEKTFETPLGCKIKPANLKGNQSWISLEGLMLKLKLQYFCHLKQRAGSLEKALMLGKIEGRKRRGTEEETVGWHHWLSGHDFEQVLGDVEEQRSLECCSPWGCKESYLTEQLNNNNETLLYTQGAQPGALWQSGGLVWGGGQEINSVSYPCQRS